MVNKTKLIHVQDIVSLYSTVNMINRFYHGIIFSNTGCEDDMIMESYSKGERGNMNIFGEPSSPYFYIHLPIIHDLRVFIQLTSF